MHVLELDRVVIATDDMDDAVAQFTDLLGLSFGERIEVSTETDAGEQPVANRISAAGLEFVTPRADDGEVARFLAEHGPGLYAVSFRVADIEAARAELEAEGISAVGTFESDELTEVFFHPQHFHGALLILAEYDAPHPMETAL